MQGVYSLQVLGSIIGVRLLIDTIPEVGKGPQLNIDIHRGALTEGLLTFAIVTISLGLSAKIPGSFYRKTWISSVSKLTLHILGSDLTGGCMNPASVSATVSGLPIILMSENFVKVIEETFFDFFSGNGMGLCSWRAHNQGAHPCILARPYGSNRTGSVDI